MPPTYSNNENNVNDLNIPEEVAGRDISFLSLRRCLAWSQDEGDEDLVVQSDDDLPVLGTLVQDLNFRESSDIEEDFEIQIPGSNN